MYDTCMEVQIEDKQKEEKIEMLCRRSPYRVKKYGVIQCAVGRAKQETTRIENRTEGQLSA